MRCTVCILLVLSLPLAQSAQSAASPTAIASERRVQTEPVHVFLVGDVMLGDQARKTLDQQGYDHPFQNLRPLFEDADLVAGNLEGPLTRLSEVLDPKKEYAYKAD